MTVVVIKIGSALLTNDGRGLDTAAVSRWAGEMAALLDGGVQVVLVSSGAVAEGMHRLAWRTRPAALYELQAAAAVGQMGVVQLYERCFQAYARHTAQVLLTHDDFESRERYLNARSTLRTLLELGVVPVVNENDAISTDDSRLGDNDTLAGLAANLIEAERLIILTDQAGLYTADPRRDGDARLIGEAQAGDRSLMAVAEGGSTLGRGGMTTKLRAAALAARSGTLTIIASGREEHILARLMDGEPVGTWLRPGRTRLAARKRWMAGQVRVRGCLHIDDGAVRVVTRAGSSLLAVGVKAVDGHFSRGEIISCVDTEGKEVARGLVNYGADECRRLAGVSSEHISQVLGYVNQPELVHRDNLVVLAD
ncbi:MAG: glutamate 5-kinase [Gammaproteobacteria bacterium]|nr:glutamate 5-kinase [Gammaproteobacteria bacterium]